MTGVKQVLPVFVFLSIMVIFLTFHLSARSEMTSDNISYSAMYYEPKKSQARALRPRQNRFRNRNVAQHPKFQKRNARLSDKHSRHGANATYGATTHHKQTANQLAKAFPKLIKYFKSEKEMNFLRELPTKLIDEYKSPCWQDPVLGLQCLPYAYLMGQPKCGTSDLYKRINYHPQFTEAKRKEVRYLTQIKSRQHHWLKNGHQSINVFTEYHSQLQEQIGNGLKNQVLIDGGPHTLWWPASFGDKATIGNVPLELLIKRLTPDVKLILTTRHPADRAYSDYNFLTQHQPRSPEGFHDRIVNQIRILNECMDEYGGVHNISIDNARLCAEHLTPCCKATDRGQGRLGISFFGPWIHKWYKIFPRKQILVLRMEDFDLHDKQMRELYMKRVFRHLGVAEVTDWGRIFPNEDISNVHHSTRKPMLQKTRKLINKFMRPINRFLVEITNDDRFYWDEYEFAKA